MKTQQDWPDCSCAPRHDMPPGFCSPKAADHEGACPRGRFIARRERRLAREEEQREKLEDAARDFGCEATEAFISSGGNRAAALKLLREI